MILVVDDDEDARFLIERAFKRAKIGVPRIYCKSGQEAKHFLEGTDPVIDQYKQPSLFLLLLDLKMPGMGGFDLLRWIRKQPIIGLLPVLVFSSSSLEEDIEEAYRLGANAFIAKPTNNDGLCGLVQTMTKYWLDYCKIPKLTLKQNI